MTVAMFAVASAQERIVTGQVIYAGDGEPLVGASVFPIGGGTGCSTDIDGMFSLKVRPKREATQSHLRGHEDR